MVELLETTRGAFKNRVCQYMNLSEEVNIVTGYISIEGIERILPYILETPKIRVLVGIEDGQYERLIDMLEDRTIRSNKKMHGHDVYDLIRYKVYENELEIVIASDIKGYRLIHSKGYLFRLKDNSVYSICGSNNLTVGGLEANKEWSLGTDKLGVYQEMLESFAIDWGLATQGDVELQEGVYETKIRDIGVGQTKSGREYLEMILEIEQEDQSILSIQRINKNQGYNTEMLEHLGILSSREGQDMGSIAEGCIGERLSVRVDSRGKMQGIE